MKHFTDEEGDQMSLADLLKTTWAQYDSLDEDSGWVDYQVGVYIHPHLCGRGPDDPTMRVGVCGPEDALVELLAAFPRAVKLSRWNGPDYVGIPVDDLS